MHDIKREETSRPVKPRIEYIPPNNEVIERIAHKVVSTSELKHLTTPERCAIRRGFAQLLNTAVSIRIQQLEDGN